MAESPPVPPASGTLPSDARPVVRHQRNNFRGLGKIIGFFALVAVIAFGLDAFFDAGLRRIKTSKYGSFNRVVNGQVNADIIINGSSRALVHYDPRVIQEATGRSAYNLGLNGGLIDLQVAVLKTYLRHNKKPALIIQNLEGFSFEVTGQEAIYDPAMFVPYLHEPELYRALTAVNPAVWKWRHIPLYGYAVEDMNFNWSRAAAAWVGIMPREDHFLGFNPRQLSWTEDFEAYRKNLKDAGVARRIDPAGVAAIEEVLRLCQEQGIRAILCYSPEYAESQALLKNRAEIFAKFRTLAARFGAEFWDYSESPLCQSTANFYNSQHLNAAGADQFSRAVAQRLKTELR
ncbi:MAG: hypothetical protein JNK23_22760 [Opitutaceae bacterium]|nr:hypothetical protein [Opitutaceae bacterium]